MTQAKFAFGKWRGRPVSDADVPYLEWFLKTVKTADPELLRAIRDELIRRSGRTTAVVIRSDGDGAACGPTIPAEDGGTGGIGGGTGPAASPPTWTLTFAAAPSTLSAARRIQSLVEAAASIYGLRCLSAVPSATTAAAGTV